MEFIKVRLTSGVVGWVAMSLGCKLNLLGRGDCVRVVKNIGSNKLLTGFVVEILMKVYVKEV